MIKFAHIAPINDTPWAIKESTFNMVLAHIADKHPDYCEMFKDSDNITLLDNGAFELGIPYPADKMIEVAKNVAANILVLPDYPFTDWRIGWLNVDSDIATYVNAGYLTMFVPQSLEGDRDGFIKSIYKALDYEGIDYVGLSILGCPNAGVTRAEILEMFPLAHKRFHILGMLDSVDEIKAIKPFEHLVNSWDSSAAVWYGVNGLSVKSRKSKFTVPVDFMKITDDKELHAVCEDNVNYIKGLING